MPFRYLPPPGGGDEECEECPDLSTNFVVFTDPGIRVSAPVTGTLVKPEAKAGVVVGSAPATLLAKTNPGIDIDTPTATGVLAVPEHKPGIVVANASSGIVVVEKKPAPQIVQVKYDLVHRKGGESQAASGNPWTTPDNALGIHNGTLATGVGDLTAARSYILTLQYTDMVNKTELTITAVRAHFYASLTGAVPPVNPASASFRWNSTNVLQAFTDNFNFLTTPATYDLFALGIDTWAEIDSLALQVRANMAAAEVLETINLDAIELEVVATITDTL